MFEYHEKIQKMSEEKLVEEMTMLQKRLIGISNTESPMYNQLLDMLYSVQDVYHEKGVKKQLKDQPSSDIIELGTIESSVHEINYADQTELLIAVVNEYKS